MSGVPIDQHFIPASLRAVGIDLRSGWTQPFHAKRCSRHNSHFNTAPQEPTSQPVESAAWRVGGGKGDRSWGEGMGGWRGDRQDGARFNGKSAIQGFSFWSQQPLLTSSSLVSAMWFCSWACLALLGDLYVDMETCK